MYTTKATKLYIFEGDNLLVTWVLSINMYIKRKYYNISSPARDSTSII
jgi:hypothetical protein